MADKFLVIDGSSLIHRAFFALPPLMNKQGVHTGAVYGLCNMLLKLLGDLQPRYMAVAFDKSRKTFRTEMYADYKGQRKPTPSELSEQFPLSMKVLDALGIHTLELDNYEADDIIGTFAKAAPEDVEVIIVTGDRDELQLVDKRTKVYYTKRGISDIQIFDEAEFAANYEGLEPKQLIELKGLMGDTSDNIPGVPGVGPKTAIKLIKEYGTVANVLANIDKVSAKALKAKLEANKESALLSQKLATICTEAPVDTNIALYELRPINESARALLQDLEFRNMYERFAAVLGGEQNSFDLFGEVVEQESAPIVNLSVGKAADKLFEDLLSAQTAVLIPVHQVVVSLLRVEVLRSGSICGEWRYTVCETFLYEVVAKVHVVLCSHGQGNIYRPCPVAVGNHLKHHQVALVESVLLGKRDDHLVGNGVACHHHSALAYRLLVDGYVEGIGRNDMHVSIVGAYPVLHDVRKLKRLLAELLFCLLGI